MSLQTSVERMLEAGAFTKIMLNPSSQFGRPGREYIGARILPERLVPNNKYTEGQIRYRTPVANDGTDYSPAQMKGGAIMGSFDVSLSNQDIASQFTAQDYENHLAVNKMNALSENNGNPTLAEEAVLSQWFDSFINVPLIEKIEKMRWEAIVDATVPLRGDNKYSKDIALSNPAGHRVAAANDWTDVTDDPMDDIYAMADAADNKGYKLSAFYCSRAVLRTLLRHPKVLTAVSGYINVSGGALVGSDKRITLAVLNAFLAEEELPPIVTYSLKYRYFDEAGAPQTAPFLKANVLVGIGNSGQDPVIDLGDSEKLPLRDTVGYVGVGRIVAQDGPGRHTHSEYEAKHPPHAYFEGLQKSFPVVTDPEAIYVTTGITTIAGVL